MTVHDERMKKTIYKPLTVGALAEMKTEQLLSRQWQLEKLHHAIGQEMEFIDKIIKNNQKMK